MVSYMLLDRIKTYTHTQLKKQGVVEEERTNGKIQVYEVRLIRVNMSFAYKFHYVP